MKAYVYERYGGPEVLQLREIDRPEPKDGEVLIRVHATSVTAGDRRVRALDIPRGFGLISRAVFGWNAPRKRILGVECAGVIEAVGSGVTRFAPGDEVVAIDGRGMGCYAEYKAMSERGAIARKPASLSFEEAAAIPFGATTALEFLRKGAVREGDAVLVNGASGGVGTAAVQLAKHFGAQVTGVCSSANAELVRALGASAVIDYTREDFVRRVERYDLIVDCVGTAPLSRCKSALKEGGCLLAVLADLPAMLGAMWAPLLTGKKVIAGPIAERAEDLELLMQLAADGKLKPVIEKRFAFEQLVEAHRHVDTGRKKGNVVVCVAP